MSNKKITVYPVGRSIQSYQKVQELYNEYGGYWHNGKMTQNKQDIITSNGTLGGYNHKTLNFTDDNPYAFDRVVSVTGPDDNNSYQTNISIGSSASKLWLPNIEGLFISMNAKTTSNNYNQEPAVVNIAISYKQYGTGNRLVYILPFPKYKKGKSGENVICGYGDSKDVYAYLTTAQRDNVVNKGYIFEKIYANLLVTRAGSISRYAKWQFWNICPLMHQPSGAGRFCMPRSLRDSNTAHVRYA